MNDVTRSATSVRPMLLASAIVIAVLVWALRDVALLVGYAVLLAYALLPAVDALVRVPLPGGRRLPRGIAAALVLLVLIAVALGATTMAAPRVIADAAQLASAAPAVMSRLVDQLRGYATARGAGDWLDSAIRGVLADSSGLVRSIGGTLAGAAARSIGSLGILLGFALLPLLAFYLMADSAAVRASALGFVPSPMRPEILRLGRSVDRALAGYIRGQAIVCIVMGAAVGIALSFLHHPSAALLGTIAGTAELIPYLGPIVAGAAIVLAGATVSPLQAVLGLAAYVVINWAVGTFITPRVMGRYLKMHPFVVTVSVLAGARLLGPAGALLALPAAAVLQAIVAELATDDDPTAGDPAP